LAQGEIVALLVRGHPGQPRMPDVSAENNRPNTRLRRIVGFERRRKYAGDPPSSSAGSFWAMPFGSTKRQDAKNARSGMIRTWRPGVLAFNRTASALRDR